MPYALRLCLTRLALSAVLSCCLSCGQAPDRTTAFHVYLAQVETWAPVEAETERTIRRILSSQFVDEALVRQEVDSAVPRVKAHLERLANSAPADQDLRRVHEEYRAAWTALLHALEDLPAAFDAGDQERLATARTALTTWRNDILHIADDLRRLRP